MEITQDMNLEHSNATVVPTPDEYTLLLYDWLTRRLRSTDNMDSELAREIVITLSERLPYYGTNEKLR